MWNEEDNQQSSFTRCQMLARELWKYGGPASVLAQGRVHSVWVNFNNGAGNTILGTQWQLLHGPRELWQSFLGVPICLTPGSFVQVNYEAFELCLRAMLPHIPPGSRITEYHAGVGAIGLVVALLTSARALKCVEVNPRGEEAFWKSADRLKDQGCEVEYWVADAGGDPGATLRGAEVVIVDPPRKGLGASLLQALTARGGHAGLTLRPTQDGITEAPVGPGSPPEGRHVDVGGPDESTREKGLNGGAAAAHILAEGACPWTPPTSQSQLDAGRVKGADPAQLHTLIYVSCGFAAFQHDCNALLASGCWSLHWARGYLFFPGTSAIETLAIFKSTDLNPT